MNRRRLLAWLAWLTSGGAGGARAQPSASLQPWTGAAAAPPLALPRLDGPPLGLDTLRGRVVLVNFWATWCEPCIEEMPSMDALHRRLAAAPFEILAVNYMEGEPRIRGFLARTPVGFPILRDSDGAVARRWQARVFPSSFVVDAAGRLRLHVTGSIDWLAPAVERALQPLLDAAGGGARR